MSWWVGKNRDAFNAELEAHTDRIMRNGAKPIRRMEPARESAPPVVAVIAVERLVVVAPPMATTTPPPVAYAKQRGYRARKVEAKECARCGKPLGRYRYHCDACQEEKNGYVRAREGYKAWRPGSRGAVPLKVKPLLEMATEARAAIEASEEAQREPALGRAGVVMLCGFYLRMKIDWIVPWTRYMTLHVKDISRNLYAAGIWREDGTINGPWCNAVFGRKKLTKKERFETDVAFWLDAMVANGDLTRETRDGQHYYGIKP